ncbi:Malto-oligosyltrehalose trehalohydrolase [Rubripirellula lacrimiformis]|uniref:Malto-oligosyltrehalose trehalohydrolase n=1 Tax=Rubripirellula lacrimiformis TaxID=1930273 RepID=A0A517N416_9BACT|nr:malto-oligosyltrehalose trehalohydrolase [Rubripirellula lacrimiformis]QDT01874.1 Malto-oligosyltrehalose trehalohydrolase [Rubripirellula lacrimiformis]
MIDVASLSPTRLHPILGGRLIASDRARFCVWSPTCDTVAVYLPDSDRQVPMQRTSGGYHVAEIADVKAGQRYFYRFDGGPDRPDPASRYQPDGVHGPSALVDDALDWSDQRWAMPAREDWVIYELHVGAFTSQGTFAAAIDRLDELVELGINVIELMPVADAAGRWNWGYDGVNLFAPNRNYGPPHDLRRLVDAAHQRGIGVILDVVYNHLGPEGNYLGQSGPYLSDRHQTVWGSAPNFDDAVHATELRRFFVANAIYWLDEFHIDGLRVDAIHCMEDDSDQHVVIEISNAIRRWSAENVRHSFLIAESNVYDETMLVPTDQGGCGFDAQWSDDFLHSFFAVVRPGEKLCHRSYQPKTDLDQVLRMGYVYAGTLVDQRGRCQIGPRVDTSGLIYNIQNHDFVGNHPLGKRLHQLTSLETQAAAATLLILSPGIPMLFMGEEFACEQPFGFFVDFGDAELRESVIAGRRREYPQHDWSGGASPVDEAAFHQAKIGPASAGNSVMRNWYRSLIAERRAWISRGLIGSDRVSIESDLDQGLFVLRYQNDLESAMVAVRLCDDPTATDAIVFQSDGQLVLDSRGLPDDGQLLPNHAKVFVKSETA